MRPTFRSLLAALLIAAVAPMGLAALDLEQPAYAKNGNGGGKGGGNGGGKGGGNGAGNAGNHGKSDSASAKGQAAKAEAKKAYEGDGLAPNELGKLNGVLHASPTAIANASLNSPIGTARAFGEALAGLLGLSDEGTTEGEGDEVADDDVAINELGEMMAKMTNKPVTAAQVQAVAAKVGIESADETTADETTEGEETAEGETPKLDQDTAQKIATKANEIHGFDTGIDDGDAGDETAEAGSTDGNDDETAVN